MNGAHFHLVINHLPIIFPLVGAIVLVTGLVSKSEAVKRTAFMIFILGAMSAFAAMATGEGAEEIVEKIGGIEESMIKTHKEASKVFALLSYFLGLLSVLGLWASFKQKAFSNIICIGALVFTMAVLFLAQPTGTTGGEIRHTEIRSGNTAPAPAPAVDQNKIEKDGDDD
jgi:uncharacterized membrane protein